MNVTYGDGVEQTIHYINRTDSSLTTLVLDVEPNLGAFAGLFRNPGFLNLGVNLNYRVGAGVTLYGNLRNALNQSYEEAFGLPSPKLNFVAGLKWSLSRAR